jgi:hypothetical protein
LPVNCEVGDSEFAFCVACYTENIEKLCLRGLFLLCAKKSPRTAAGAKPKRGSSAKSGLRQPGRKKRGSAALHWEYGNGNGHGKTEERSVRAKAALRMTAYGYGNVDGESEERCFGERRLPGLQLPGRKLRAG